VGLLIVGHVATRIKIAVLRLPPQMASHLAESSLRFDLRENLDSVLSFIGQISVHSIAEIPANISSDSGRLLEEFVHIIRVVFYTYPMR
jgi:hypothetical protein